MKPGTKRHAPELRARVLELWNTGSSGSEIADAIATEFGERLSRNAVIGAVSRGRAMGVRLAPRARVAKPKNPPPPANRKRDLRASPQGGGGTLAIVSAPVALLDANGGHCRWPLWDGEGAPEFSVCGAKRPEGQSYCAGHHALGQKRA